MNPIKIKGGIMDKLYGRTTAELDYVPTFRAQIRGMQKIATNNSMELKELDKKCTAELKEHLEKAGIENPTITQIESRVLNRKEALLNNPDLIDSGLFVYKVEFEAFPKKTLAFAGVEYKNGELLVQSKLLAGSTKKEYPFNKAGVQRLLADELTKENQKKTAYFNGSEYKTFIPADLSRTLKVLQENNKEIIASVIEHESVYEILGEQNEAEMLRLLKTADTIEPNLTDEKMEYFIYLDELRESGITNMWGARPYLIEEFGLESGEAAEILGEWMRTFSARHPEARKAQEIEGKVQLAGEGRRVEKAKRKIKSSMSDMVRDTIVADPNAKEFVRVHSQILNGGMEQLYDNEQQEWGVVKYLMRLAADWIRKNAPVMSERFSSIMEKYIDAGNRSTEKSLLSDEEVLEEWDDIDGIYYDEIVDQINAELEDTINKKIHPEANKRTGKILKTIDYDELWNGIVSEKWNEVKNVGSANELKEWLEKQGYNVEYSDLRTLWYFVKRGKAPVSVNEKILERLETEEAEEENIE